MRAIYWLKGASKCTRWLQTHDRKPYGGGIERCTYCGGVRRV